LGIELNDFYVIITSQYRYHIFLSIYN